MSKSLDIRRSTLNRRHFMVGASAAAAAPLAMSWPGMQAAAQESVTLTMWSWINGIDKQIALFEAANPNIKVELTNPDALVEKLRTALRAGSGAPDVTQLEMHMLPTFDLIKGLEDLSAYGASDLQPIFEEWVWSVVAPNGRVVGLPNDSGPIGMIHRSDVFERFDITPPATWDEFAEAAIKLHEASPEHYLVDATFNDQTWTGGLLQQAGWRPFKIDGTTLEVRVNDEAAKKFARYWQTLLDAKAIDTAPGFNNEWYTAFDQGKYATWLVAAWGPLFLSQFAANSAGKWRVAPIPQWDTAAPRSGNMGGSSFSVTTQSNKKEAAAELVKFLSGNVEAAAMFAKEQFLFPVVTEVLNSPDFASQTSEFYGGQAVNEVFIESSTQIERGFQYSPFQDFVGAQFESELAVAAASGTSLEEAFDRMQANVVEYASAQGFTVIS
ncbi:extracellular solute-binding protein [Devosia sp. BK]|uniref:extracellular solute-binding protein n=1 Tax=Devosia sp. BK TaxID=2871706 RepID=UPI00293B4FD9|nr:extracellular solute-binding protein [Devosia sp. BK]MDV3253762.1 extracellular solute-binding protein [Devosia sp. BK]